MPFVPDALIFVGSERIESFPALSRRWVEQRLSQFMVGDAFGCSIKLDLATKSLGKNPKVKDLRQGITDTEKGARLFFA